MKKPTKRKRNEIYKKILKEVIECGWYKDGFCHFLCSYTDYDFFLSFWIEIKKHKPNGKSNGEYWFPQCIDKDPIREKILRQAIRETNPKKNDKKIKN